MSSSSERGPGRPSGYDPETLERIRRVRDDERKGFTIPEIAAREQVSTSYIKLLKRAPIDGATRARKPPPARLNERALAHHAVLAMRRDTRLRAFDAGKKLFWLDCVMEIHALGDDDGLGFGADGDPFETHPEFALALGGKPDDLEHFLRRGLLTRRPDGRIDLPLKIGLKPKEQPRVMLPGSGEQPLAQRFETAADNVNEDSETPPISLSKRTEKSPQFHYPSDSETPPISLSQADLARAAVADAKDKVFQNLSISNSTGSRASGGDSEIGQFHCPPDSEIRDSDITSERSPEIGPVVSKDAAVIGLAAALKTLSAPGREPNTKEIGIVQRWLDAGESEATLRAVVECRMNAWKGPPPNSLAYFEVAVREAREARHHQAAPKPNGHYDPAAKAEAAKVVEDEPEEPIIGTGLDAQWARVRRGLKRTMSRTDWTMFAGKAELDGDVDEDGVIKLSLPSAYLRDSVRSRWGDRFATLWRTENRRVMRVDFVWHAVNQQKQA